MRVYLDSNVLISFLRSEIDGAFNLRFSQTDEFFVFCRQKTVTLVLSDFFLFEVKKIVFLDKKGVEETFQREGIPYEFVSDAPTKKAGEISWKTGIHYADARHVANALESNCNAVVSWNIKDMKKARLLISSFTPLEFVQNIP